MIDKEEIQRIKQRMGIIGNSALLNRDIEVAVQVAPTDLTVLVVGESGVGKEHFPQIIHQYSSRKHGPYFAVNCGAIPEGTIDSELFGHEKGSFTDAKAERRGYFEQADGGTLFLDEVGELPLSTQVRLLRVLETGEFLKVGSSKVQKTNVRVVAATNVDFASAIAEGRFREDLYYRLNTIEIRVPALRDRKEDIPMLFRKFAADCSEKYRMPAIRLTPDAVQMLQNYYWRGNIRQLKNLAEQISVVETQREINAQVLAGYLPQNDFGRAPALFHTPGPHEQIMSDREIFYYRMLLELKRDITDMKEQMASYGMNDGRPADKNRIYAAPADIEVDSGSSQALFTPATAQPIMTAKSVDTEDFQPAEEVQPEETHADSPDKGASATMRDVQRETIRQALERNNFNRKQTAKELQISERTLYRKISEFGLDS